MPRTTVDNYVSRPFTRKRNGRCRLKRKELRQIEELVRQFLADIGDMGGIWQFDYNCRKTSSSCDTGVVVEVRLGQHELRQREMSDSGRDNQLLHDLRSGLTRHTVALRLLPARDAIFYR